MMTKKITDTTREANENPLHTMLTAGFPGGIEEQEKRGQEELAQSQQIPREMLYCTEEQLTALGFRFDEDSGDDPVFRNGSLPTGWKIQPTDHSMHSDMVDEKGRRRGGIFYKAAFYDRKAHISLASRFSVRQNYEPPTGTVVCEVHDAGAIVHTVSRKFDGEKYSPDYYVASNAAKAEAMQLLSEGYPDHENVLAYWD